MKDLSHLKKMTKEDLIDHFNEMKYSKQDLYKILDSIDIKTRERSWVNLVEFAAIQISLLGVYERIAQGEGS